MVRQVSINVVLIHTVIFSNSHCERVHCRQRGALQPRARQVREGETEDGSALRVIPSPVFRRVQITVVRHEREGTGKQTDLSFD